MLYSSLKAITVLSLIALAQGVAVDTEESSTTEILNKRGFNYDSVKKALSEKSPGAGWAVAFFDGKDCSGSLLGHVDTDTQNPQPCQSVDDMKSKPDKTKIQSGAVFLRGGDSSFWSARLIEKGDKLSPCGMLNTVSPSGWIGASFGKLPEDGWTCKNGKFTAYSVREPGMKPGSG
ncbi:MAG: hypothetical protein M1835_004348 [Candelina submexicana]|nr:MAG: hypothetical protein M1835_004348 [Candelina submexicana]